MTIDLDGLSAFEATKGEFAEATRQLVRLLRDAGTIPEEAIPGWVGGAAITAIVEELR